MTQAPRKEYLPPTDIAPSALVADLISRGRPPFKVVDFPRYDELGKPIHKVRLRLLTITEQDLALANARKYVARLISGGDSLEWRPEELERDAKAMEILAVACRKNDGTDEPFFAHGVFEARAFFNATELGVLINTYAQLNSVTHPKLTEMNEAEMKAWLAVIAEGMIENPFSYLSQGDLEILCEYAAKSLAALGQLPSGQPTT